MNSQTNEESGEVIDRLTPEDLPNLYRSASVAASEAQKSFFRALGWSFFLLVVVTTLSAINWPSSGFALMQAIALLVSLTLTAYLSFKQPQRKWYAARALAESVKTVTWRFMMRAEPYGGTIEVASGHLVENLRKILADNNVLRDIVTVTHGAEITPKMSEVRRLSLVHRRNVYDVLRIGNQLE